MKRSEMIEKIAEIISDNKYYSLTEEHLSQASKVLSAIEEAGMKPPENGTNWDSDYSDNEYWCAESPRHEWDKE